MSAPGQAARDQALPVDGMGLGQAAATLVTVAAAQGYDVTTSGPNRFQLRRSVRPWWANVLALVLAPLLGLGLLLLRVRRTEGCEGIILEERNGVRINLGGLEDADLYLALHTALTAQAATRERGPRPTAYASADPVWAAPEPSTSAPPQFDRTLTIAQLAAMRSRIAPALRLPDGRVVPVGAGVIVGRSPDRSDDHPSAQLIALADASLSKTHASFAPTTDGVSVRDHGSTNGTAIEVRDSTTRCQPGARVNVPIGGVVRLGEVRIDVVAGTS